MVSTPLLRKLAAILYTDVVGYSRLSGEDEYGTHRQLSACLDLISDTILHYSGRVVHYAGDAVLADFSTVTQALACAAAIQGKISEHNADLAEERKVRFRIGVNLGEVIVDRNDIYGEGVNVAARLESLAKPGGICISESVRTAVGKKLPFNFEFMGEQQVKNIAEPVRAYHAELEAGAELSEVVAVEVQVASKARRPAAMAAGVGAIAVIAVAAVLFWWQPWAMRDQQDANAGANLPLPDKPSIAVLPFTNMSDDRAQEYFVDGMTEDLITDLSKISSLFVIARNSSFTYKGKSPNVRDVARDLGVNYVLEGSVRRAGDQVRINAQLIDAVSGGHLWAERYDGLLADVFSLQDKVTESIVAALAVTLTAREKELRGKAETQYVAAYDAFLRGWSHFRRDTPHDFYEAVPYFERAIKIDPNYGRPYAALAALYASAAERDMSLGTSAWRISLGVSLGEAFEKEDEYLARALVEPSPLAYFVSSSRLSRQGQHDEAVAEATRAVELDSNDPIAHEAVASALIYAGRHAESLEPIDRAMRLDPLASHRYLYWLGLARFGMEDFSNAAPSLGQAVQENPNDVRSLIVLAAAYGHLGKSKEAAGAMERANELRSVAQRRAEESESVRAGIDALLGGPYTLNDANLWYFEKSEDRERLRDGLKLAGVPEAGENEKVSPLEVPGAITVDVDMAKALFDRGVTFIDVLPDNSWRDGHIPGAIHLDFKDAFTEASLSAVVDRGQEVVIYCLGPRCLRSSEASAKAVSWGFKKVYYFREGLPAWKAAGYPINVP